MPRCFWLRLCGEGAVTKRVVLSETARLFDPLGWLIPVVMRAKLTIQALWMRRVEWDQPLRDEDESAWQLLRRELSLLEGFRVPHWLHIAGSSTKMEIHGFADASE